MTEPEGFQASGNPFENLSARHQLNPTLLNSAEELYQDWRIRRDAAIENESAGQEELPDLYDLRLPRSENHSQLLGRSLRFGPQDIQLNRPVVDFSDQNPVPLFTFLDPKGPGVPTYGGYAYGQEDNHLVGDEPLLLLSERLAALLGPLDREKVIEDAADIFSSATSPIAEGQVVDNDYNGTDFGPQPQAFKPIPSPWFQVPEGRSPVDFSEELAHPGYTVHPQNNSQEGDK